MSMNIYIFATRQVQVLSTGEVEEQHIKFDAIQTPTKVTWEILAHYDIGARLNAYKKYVLDVADVDTVVNVYAKDDIFEEYYPVGTRVVNWGKEHIEGLAAWGLQAMGDGYTIHMEAT